MKSKTEVGVIVARFQVPSLHAGHIHLIEYVRARHEKVLVVLGSTGGQLSNVSPLTFDVRKAMVLARYPSGDVSVLEHFDRSVDADWSKDLDILIRDSVGECGAVLYGSRNSFIPHYLGVYRTEEVAELASTSGTEVRNTIAKQTIPSYDFRAGMIYASQIRFPTSYQTIDVAVMHDDGRVLLGYKNTPSGKVYLFPGGFVDPDDISLEHAARRELSEEVGINLEVDEMKYVGSLRPGDPRYRGSQDSVLTAFFVTRRLCGFAEAHDDLAGVEWVDPKEAAAIIWPGHRALVERLLTYLGT